MGPKRDWASAFVTGGALTMVVAFFFVLGLFKTANATQAEVFSWSNFYDALPLNALIILGFLAFVVLGVRKR